METLMGQVYNPHLKKVLKTYQLSAPKSLQGPSTVLTTEVHTKKEPCTEPSPEPPFTTPPPLPIQQLPILTAPDRSPSQRCETLLQGERITCFLVGGEKRLCLPQILNSILRDFSLAQINQVCDSLQIFCSRCNPEQLDELKETGILPKSAPSCGLITKTDAERLCSTLLHRALAAPTGLLKNALGFTVYHECFGKCRGMCLPELYSDCEARCIECLECHGLLSPRQFVCHSHRSPENRTCHWGFDSDNWRAYLLLCRDQPDIERREKLLDMFKQQYLKSNTLKQILDSMGGTARLEWSRKEIEEVEDEVVAAKKLKLDDSFVGTAPNSATAAAYLQQYDTAFHYYTWYDPYVRSMSSAFRPWHHTLTHLDEKPFTDRTVTSVPAYLSHDPPVLLHPERVVPLSESERFERSYQPNVALAPRSTVLDQRRTEVKMEDVSNEDKKPPVGLMTTKGQSHNSNNNCRSYFNPEIELSTDTDDSTSEHHDPAKGSAVEQVAAVFAALSDAKETTRKVVIGLVQKLAARLDSIEAENRRLLKDNVSLRQQINKAKESRCHQRNEEVITTNVGEVERIKIRSHQQLQQHQIIVNDKIHINHKNNAINRLKIQCNNNNNNKIDGLSNISNNNSGQSLLSPSNHHQQLHQQHQQQLHDVSSTQQINTTSPISPIQTMISGCNDGIDDCTITTELFTTITQQTTPITINQQQQHQSCTNNNNNNMNPLSSTVITPSAPLLTQQQLQQQQQQHESSPTTVTTFDNSNNITTTNTATTITSVVRSSPVSVITSPASINNKVESIQFTTQNNNTFTTTTSVTPTTITPPPTQPTPSPSLSPQPITVNQSLSSS